MTRSYTRASPMYKRFRGFLPVVVDIETGGTDPLQNPLLEIAAVFLEISDGGLITIGREICDHIVPYAGSIIEKEALEINRIDPDYPLRFPRDETDVMKDVFDEISKELKISRCKRAILVGHNAHFDLSFLREAATRSKLEDSNPFHAFSVLDTVTIGALAYGQTILSLACDKAKIDFNNEEAHSALYDARKTAELFCKIVNEWLCLGGWDEVNNVMGRFTHNTKK